MLEELRISGLGVIGEAALELHPGLTVLTGETGAGKTLVVTGLALLLGGRADVGLVAAGAARAVVEGRFSVDADGPVAARAGDAGADLDDGGLLAARVLSAEGRSRAYLGGRAVPVSVLGELADGLVAWHGQGQAARLVRPSAQRAALDRYAGPAVAEPLAGYVTAFERWRVVGETLTRLTGTARERAQQAELLRHGLDEITAAAPEPGEDAALAVEVRRLAHADGLRRAAQAAHQVLAGEPDGGTTDAGSLLAEARRTLAAEVGHDPALDALARRVAEAGYLVADAAADLASYAANVDADPIRLAAAQDRQAVLGGLLRRYGADTGEVLAWAEQARDRLGALDGDDERIDALTAERAALLGVLGELAGRLHEARTAAAGRFGAAVTAELTELAMPHADVTAAVRCTPDPNGLIVGERPLAFGPAGVDEVELLLAPHPGASPRPLGRGASGGELARVMLAVEVVLGDAAPVPTFVFDEVDAGVGGRAAVEVGQRLARLATGAQVLVVTHLPQVAAFADRHYVVTKDVDGTVSRSGVRAVDGPERLRELSRMLAGLDDSELAQGHAEELLAVAAAARPGE